MTHTPRRLRPPRAVTVLTYNGPGEPVDTGIAEQVRDAWRRSIRTGVVIVDGRTWTVQRVPR